LCLLVCLQECEALGVSAPALTQLEDIAADIAGVKGSWVVYQEFLAERDELAHKDWLSMRDQVCVAKPALDFDLCLSQLLTLRLG
jgi:hypothetical protein